MTEFWVSRKKYFCQYCECFITDDKPSRTHHENGQRHQGNKERYVRGIYKTGEKRKRELADEQREMAAINQAAGAAFAGDIAAGRAGSGGASLTPSSSKPAAGPSKPPKPVDKWANYTTAASLGIRDDDADRQALFALQRQSEGIVGAWQYVAPPLPSSSTSKAPEEPVIQQEEDLDIKPPPKPKHEAPPADDDGDTRNFKVRKKAKATYGLGQVYDPGVIKVKKREEERAAQMTQEQESLAEKAAEEQEKIKREALAQQVLKQHEEQQSADSSEQKSKGGWKPASSWEQVDEVNTSIVIPREEEQPQDVPVPEPVVDEPQKEPEPEPVQEEPQGPAVTFKKRKGPANTVRRGGGGRVL